MAKVCANCGHYCGDSYIYSNHSDLIFCSESCKEAYYQKLETDNAIRENLEKQNLRAEQARAAEKIKDNYCLFGLERDDFRRRVAENGFYEYKLAGCVVSDFSGNETCKSSTATCSLKIGSLLNKTPEGTGKLTFGLLFIPVTVNMYGEPFITDTDSETGLDYWKNNYWQDGSSGWRFSYLSKPFTLQKGENIDNKHFSLSRTSVGMCSGEHKVYVVLIEQIDSGKNRVVAWGKAGSHVVKTPSENDSIRFSSPFCSLAGLELWSGRATAHISGGFSVYGNEGVDGLWARIVLTDVKTGTVYKSKSSDYFSVDASGNPYPFVSGNLIFDIDCVFDESIPEGVYHAEITFCMEQKSLGGKSKILDKLNTECASSGFAVSCEENAKIGKKAGCPSKVFVTDASHIRNGSTVTIKFKELSDYNNNATGDLKICLENGSNVCATFYLEHLSKGKKYIDLERTVEYTPIQENYREDEFRIVVYEAQEGFGWQHVGNAYCPSESYKKKRKAELEKHFSDVKLENNIENIKNSITRGITRNLLNIWCILGIICLCGSCVDSKFLLIPAIFFTPWWLLISEHYTGVRNEKLIPVFFVIWSVACLFVHFTASGGVFVYIGVIIYAFALRKILLYFKPRLLVFALAAIILVSLFL
ncbi:hypothetical protein [Treponema sp.]|uniref:hypothetical protein n=1 Tax=Treponema sp. TaxID=166 RepID=UPI0025E198C5|nr:hypothetical protein [Treponema sp.]MBR4321951.1 hypothetical protein [Treponema sp.]